MSDDQTRYLHGTAPDEQDRLGLMNELLNANSLREMHLAPGERVLDVGCGLGQLSRDVARQVGPAGLVVAVERSSEQLEVARRLAAEARALSISQAHGQKSTRNARLAPNPEPSGLVGSRKNAW